MVSFKILGSLETEIDYAPCNRNESLSQRFRSRLTVSHVSRSRSHLKDQKFELIVIRFQIIDVTSRADNKCHGFSTSRRKSRKKIAPPANDLAACHARHTWATHAYNHAAPYALDIDLSRTAYFSRRIRQVTRPKLVLRSAREAVPSAAGKVTVPLSRVPRLPGSRQTGSRLIYQNYLPPYTATRDDQSNTFHFIRSFRLRSKIIYFNIYNHISRIYFSCIAGRILLPIQFFYSFHNSMLTIYFFMIFLIYF